MPRTNDNSFTEQERDTPVPAGVVGGQAGYSRPLASDREENKIYDDRAMNKDKELEMMIRIGSREQAVADKTGRAENPKNTLALRVGEAIDPFARWESITRTPPEGVLDLKKQDPFKIP